MLTVSGMVCFCVGVGCGGRMMGCLAVAIFVVGAETRWVRLRVKVSVCESAAFMLADLILCGRPTELATDCSVDPWAHSCHPASMMVFFVFICARTHSHTYPRAYTDTRAQCSHTLTLTLLTFTHPRLPSLTQATIIYIITRDYRT